MRLFKLKTSRLALIFSIVMLVVHLGIGYLVAAVIKDQMLGSIWQRSLKVYWPAMDLIQVLRLNVNVGVLMGVGMMIATALLEWWVIFATGIWLVRLYFWKPPISNVSKIAIPIIVLVIAVCFYEASPETLGMSKYQRFRFDVSAGNIDKVRETLKHNPRFANKVQPGWGTALHEAARSGRAEIAELLLENGSDIKTTELEGDTPLHTAIKWGGHEDVVKVLIAHKADVNAGDNDGKTPLFLAASGGHTNIILLLLANGADINTTDKYGNCALTGAICNNRYGVVPLLLSNGANPIIRGSIGDTLDRAALQDSPALAESLLPYFTGTNSTKYLSEAFSSAFEFGHMDVAIPISVAALRFESNSIYEAAFNGNVDDVRAQLESQPDLLNAKDFLGLSPLHRAAQAGQDAIVRLLLAKSADIGSIDQNGNTPLHWAVFTGQSNVVETLIDNKAGLNIKGARERSPLYLAVQQGFAPLAGMLLKAGADPNIATSGGETPLCVAVANGNVEALKLLLAYHANFSMHIYGDTLFHVWARGTANLDVANLLLANGCDADAKGHEGKTALHALVETANIWRVQEGQMQAVQWLLDHKADVNAKDDKGQTPLSLLKSHNRGRIIERRKDIGDLLRKYGAKE
jgi:ankyrin repeat protein